jgi:hypothetical protein
VQSPSYLGRILSLAEREQQRLELYDLSTILLKLTNKDPTRIQVVKGSAFQKKAHKPIDPVEKGEDE